MRIRRPHRRSSREITGVFCTTCQKISDVKEIETHTMMTTFALRCGHTVTLMPGAICRLDVQADMITLHPNRTDLLVRQRATS